MAKQDYEREWEDLKIKYLILASKDRYVVFIDDENDLDWKTSDKFDETEFTNEIKRAFYEVKNEIDSTENIPCNLLDTKTIINFKRQVGEALVRAFEQDYENAKKMIKIARDYVIKRNVEQSRYMYLSSSALTASGFFVLGIILWLLRYCFLELVGETVFFLILSFISGAIGALLSIILRLGKTEIDFNASPKLHYLEGASRILAGMISGFLIALTIKAGILLPIFTKMESTHLAMILGGLAAGSSERLAPSIISKLDGPQNSNKK